MTQAEEAQKKRARGTVKARKNLTKVERIAHIVGVMAQNQWVTGVTGPELAKRWKLSI